MTDQLDRIAQLDLLARRASSDMDTTTTADPDLGLRRVFAAHTRHRSHSRVAVAAVLFAALSAGWLGRGVVTGDRVAPTVVPTSPPPHVVTTGLCQQSNIRCLGQRTFRFGLVTPVVWHFPRGFGVANGGPTTTTVESFWTHRGNNAGVSVLEAIVPAAPDSRPAAGFLGGADPRVFAEWLATRPFLTAHAPVRTNLGGRTAWRVRVRVAPGAGPGSGTCAQRFTCHPITATDGGSITGIWSDMVADYTFVRLPSGTAVVWSWAFGHDTAALARNRGLADGISWPAH